MTTNAEKSYEKDVESKRSLRDACRNGYISLIVVYPASKGCRIVPYREGNRLVGYIGQEEMEALFDKKLCAFLKSLKKGSTSKSTSLLIK